MGIQGFTKLFEYNKELKYKDFKEKNIVIDSMVEIYRAALGMKSTHALTDPSGNPTAHINTILLGVIFKLKACGANQYWVFDYPNLENTTHHNPLKELELSKRREKRKKANEEIEKILKKRENNKIKEDDLFSDTDNDNDDIDIDDNDDEKINKYKKSAFCLEEFYIADVKFMLDCLNIPWIEAPEGYESEQICAILTNSNNLGVPMMDYVLTIDADTLLFGAKKIIKRDLRKKKLFEYSLETILNDYKLTQNELIKIGLILGSDFAPKTSGVGPKTILKNLTKTQLKNKTILETLNPKQLKNKENLRKIDILELSIEQTKAYNEIFLKSHTWNNADIVKKWNNINAEPFNDKYKINQLLDWLELVKGFNRSRIQTQINKL
jgi:hypothetical protein